MIYLDSAATTLQKPRAVAQASAAAMGTLASPGRGGHAPAMRAADLIYDCRVEISKLLGVSDAAQIVFTSNATHGLNIAIRSLVSAGDRVVISGYEHNAVTRALRLSGADIDAAASPLFDSDAAYRAFAARLPGAKIAVCTHVSNVFGFVLPIHEIAAQCRRLGIPLVIDASQSAGVLDIDASRLDAAFIAMPGHKGLLGPQGTGVLVCGADSKPLMAGGTGSDSVSQEMPAYLPERLEAGTHNVCGIAGLLEGVRYVRRRGCNALRAHETALTRDLAGYLERVDALEVFSSEDASAQTGVLSVRHASVTCEALGEALGAAGVAVRAGLHCAPLAHSSAGTLETGTVRFSVSPFNTREEMRAAAKITNTALKKLMRD